MKYLNAPQKLHYMYISYLVLLFTVPGTKKGSKQRNMNHTDYLQTYDERMGMISVRQTEGQVDDGILQDIPANCTV
jgi:hypothetical protein